MLNPEPLAGPAHSGLDFICYKQDPVLSEPLEQFEEIIIRRDYVATFSLDRLDEKGGDFLWGDVLVEVLLLNVINAGKTAVGILLLQGASVAVRIWNVLNHRK